ncbi:hypothetical protein Nmel_016020 [Mimus melanotis]
MLGRSVLRRRPFSVPLFPGFPPSSTAPLGAAGAWAAALPAGVTLSACCSPAMFLRIPQRAGASEGSTGRRDVTCCWRVVVPLFPWREKVIAAILSVSHRPASHMEEPAQCPRPARGDAPDASGRAGEEPWAVPGACLGWDNPAGAMGCVPGALCRAEITWGHTWGLSLTK